MLKERLLLCQNAQYASLPVIETSVVSTLPDPLTNGNILFLPFRKRNSINGIIYRLWNQCP